MHATGWLLEAVGVKIVLHGVLAVYILRLLYYSILQHLVRPASLAAVCELPVLESLDPGCLAVWPKSHSKEKKEKIQWLHMERCEHLFNYQAL